MERFDELKDNYARINPWGRELLRDLANDFRKLFPNEDLQKQSELPPDVHATKELISQGIEGGLPVGTTDPVSGD
jgi:hypothetical protein